MSIRRGMLRVAKAVRVMGLGSAALSAIGGIVAVMYGPPHAAGFLFAMGVGCAVALAAIGLLAAWIIEGFAPDDDKGSIPPTV